MSKWCKVNINYLHSFGPVYAGERRYLEDSDVDFLAANGIVTLEDGTPPVELTNQKTITLQVNNSTIGVRSN